jgi:integrase
MTRRCLLVFSSAGLSAAFQTRRGSLITTSTRPSWRCAPGGPCRGHRISWQPIAPARRPDRTALSHPGGRRSRAKLQGIIKNREGRDVDLISDVVALLAFLRNASSNDDLVFPGTNGQRFLSPTVVLRRHLYPAMTSAGIRRVGPTQEKRTFHSFRHTFAKRALESVRRSLGSLANLGHSSLKVTTDIYGHWERAERKLQAAKMENAFPV